MRIDFGRRQVFNGPMLENVFKTAGAYNRTVGNCRKKQEKNYGDKNETRIFFAL
jgi:hypothetical protein